MRIRSVRIDSFGRLHDRRFDLADGLNVFHGPNESGKTTVMEFIRTTLVKNDKRELYPARADTDGGVLAIEENGELSEIRRERKDHIGEVPEYIGRLGFDEYRSIFAMNASDLDNESLLSDEIHSRFLSIPGGECVPAVIEDINNGCTSVAGKIGSNRSSKKSELAVKKDLIDSTEQRIAELRDRADSYNEKKQEKESLESKLAEVRERNSAARENNSRCDQVERVRPTYERLKGLREEYGAIGRIDIVTDEQKSTYGMLDDGAKSKTAAFEALRSSRARSLETLPVKDEDVLSDLLPSIERVVEQKDLYARPEAMRQEAVVRKRNPIAYVLPLVVMALGIVPIMTGMSYGPYITLAAEIAGIAILAFMLLRKPARTIAPMPRADPMRGAYESDVSDLAMKCGYRHTTVDGDLANLAKVLSVMNGLRATRKDYDEKRAEMLEAKNKLEGFLSQFRGIDGYQDALKKTERRSRLESEMSAASKVLSDAGFDPSGPLPEMSRIDFDDSEEVELGKAIGSLGNEMKSILDTRELDAQIDVLSNAVAERDRILRDAAKLILSSRIIDGSCEEMYRTVQPSVITTADRYLSMMTLGRYRFDADPRREGLSIVDSDGVKTAKQWSTGLRAQALLSLKLAVAKEMGEGKIPVILDDVLLVFDRERKKGACEALAEVSKEMQVLMFTCDESVAEICSTIDGANLVKMA